MDKISSTCTEVAGQSCYKADKRIVRNSCEIINKCRKNNLNLKLYLYRLKQIKESNQLITK